MELRVIESRPILIDQVYEQLVDAISVGTLPPGHRLRQEHLAADLGVSRQPVSHALAMLKNAGLAVEKGVRGLVVAPIDPERLYHLFEVRAALEGLSASLAARRVASEPSLDVDVLREIIGQGSVAEARQDIRVAVDWDLQFHAAIHVLSGNTVLTEVAEAQRPQVRRVMAVVKTDPVIARRVWAEHAAIADAIRAGDPGAAERLARDHAATAGVTTRRRLIAQAGAGAGASGVNGRRNRHATRPGPDRPFP